jgi:molybdenum cofactor guanylyltransferase
VTVAGAVLVGGASTRFGSPKALALVGGRTLAERAWEALAWCDERFLVGKRTDALALPGPLVDDGEALRAPIVGVVAALRHARTDVCVCLPVDCPAITAEALRGLAAACVDAAVPPTGPLPGAYRRTCLPVLERRLAERRLSLREALAELDVADVAVDAAQLANANRPAELAALAGRLR